MARNDDLAISAHVVAMARNDDLAISALVGAIDADADLRADSAVIAATACWRGLTQQARDPNSEAPGGRRQTTGCCVS